MVSQLLRSPDDELLRLLALDYASPHPRMSSGRGCPGGGHPDFPGGATMGADWYEIRGGMQDFAYFFSDAPELTLEVSCCKFPPAADLRGHWGDNREGILRTIENAHRQGGSLPDQVGKSSV